jgi:16S rRNA (guanine527-N7)-methyltransferase
VTLRNHPAALLCTFFPCRAECALVFEKRPPCLCRSLEIEHNPMGINKQVMLPLNLEEKRSIRSWAADFGISLSSSQLSLFRIYLDELWDWNKQINLTGLSSRKGIIDELLLDSLLPLPSLPEKGRLLDVGSGAGFPAIPLKICRPLLLTHLLEVQSKKVSFLRQVIRLTGLRKIEVMRVRIEKAGGILHPAGYHIITTRALAHLPQTLAWCAPYLRPGGLIVNFQGSEFRDKLMESSGIIEKHRLELFKSIPYTLPGKHSQRHLLIFKKHE